MEGAVANGPHHRCPGCPRHEWTAQNAGRGSPRAGARAQDQTFGSIVVIDACRIHAATLGPGTAGDWRVLARCSCAGADDVH